MSKVYQCSQTLRYLLFEADIETCIAYCKLNHWKFVDENYFVWSLEID